MRMKETERKKIENNFYIVGLCLIGVLLILLLLKAMTPKFLEFLQIPCMLYTLTGLYCPGCGGTRAVAVLLRGEILKSFCYHPIVLYGVVIYVWFMISHTIEKASKGKYRIGMRYRDIYLWLALAIVVINIAVKDIALTAFDLDILKILDGAGI